MSANKWIPLNGKKDPPAGEPVMIWIKKEDMEWWTKATLSRIEFEGAIKKWYVFDDSNANEVKEATHFAIIEPPKE